MVELAFSGQDLNHLRGQFFGSVAQGFSRHILNGMGSEDRRVVFCAPHSGHTFRCRDEPVSTNCG